VAELFEDVAVLMLRHLIRRDEISLTAAGTLSRLHRSGPARLTSLAADEGVTQPSMTQLVQRMERQGLITRVADPGDGRVVLVAITEAGRELVRQRRRARIEHLSALLSQLAPADEAALTGAATAALPALQRLIQNAVSASTVA
jgi:DNA-binding MarR family transcriptional regulator